VATPAAAVEVKALALRRAARGVLPGFGLTLGYTMLYLSLLVLIPLSAVFIRSLGLGWGHFYEVVTSPQGFSSVRQISSGEVMNAKPARTRACQYARNLPVAPGA